MNSPIVSLLTLLVCLFLRAASAYEPAQTNGPGDADFASVDRTILAFMHARHVPGGSVAVVKDGRLIYARGYGLADVAKNIPVQPTSLFRIASISKPFTSAAVMMLIQKSNGTLTLDTKVFDYLGLNAMPGKEAQFDPRWRDITVRQLLQHTGGFDRGKSGDPMFQLQQVREVLNLSKVPGTHDIIQYMLTRPLDFTPGSREAYSNFGYCVLGRIIEKASGEHYDAYVKHTLLAPMGIRDIRLAHMDGHQRAPNEVEYYHPALDAKGELTDGPSTVVGDHEFVIENMDSHGGWLASAVELARFAARMDRPEKTGLLTAESVTELYARPAAPVGHTVDGQPSAAYYALGWNIRPMGTNGKANIWHNGSLPGTSTLLVRRWDGLTWAVLFNQRAEGKMPSDSEIDGAMHAAINSVTSWPSEDLFETIP